MSSLLIGSILVSFGSAQQLAFPGAEGFGRFVTGGRDGKVIEVSTVNDSGPGSLREAVESHGKRTIVFRISGTIALQSPLILKNPDVTIAGQTAPGDGICIRNYPLIIDTDNVIIRFIRIRLGDETKQEEDAIDCVNHQNIMVDHCSASWSVDEACSIYAIDSLTIQWCLISESLYQAHHEKGAHGYGGIWGGNEASFHHNLFAHHSSRTPRFAGNETPACQNADFRNNVIYNWGFNSIYGGEAGTINIVANYFKSGPATQDRVRNRICEPYGADGRWYIEDNYVEGFLDVTSDNWDGGVQVWAPYKSVIRVDVPFPHDTVTTQTPEAAYNSVLDHAGANFPKQDIVDARIISEVTSGSATYDGTHYELEHGFSDTSVTRGIIDSQSEVGGWPDLISQSPPEDSDRDGMPDQWETEHGLDPFDASDRNFIDVNQYTMLENYLNGLITESSTGIQESPSIPTDDKLMQNYPNPFNAVTVIPFRISETGHVTMTLYNVVGQQVMILTDQNYDSGRCQVVFDAAQVSAGIYFYKIETSIFTKVKKMMLMK